MKKTLKKIYDVAFKKEAVRLVMEEKRKASHVERELGITSGLLKRWINKVNENAQHPFPGSGYQRPEDAEITKLRRENERLKRECEILKKATAIFSRNQ